MDSSSHQTTKQGKQNIRLIKNFAVFMDDHLGKGQYGNVCKAKLVDDIKSNSKKIYACKIMEVANIKPQEMACIEKEVDIHNRVKSDHCLRLYQAVKTQSNLYMLLDYCNGLDL